MKKIISMVLVFVLVLSMAACNQDTPDVTETDGTHIDEILTDPTESTAADPTEPAGETQPESQPGTGTHRADPGYHPRGDCGSTVPW